MTDIKSDRNDGWLRFHMLSRLLKLDNSAEPDKRYDDDKAMMRLIKKIIFALCVLGLLYPVAITNAVEIKLYISPLKVQSNKSFNIPIMISKADNLAGLKLSLSYDDKVLKYENDNFCSRRVQPC